MDPFIERARRFNRFYTRAIGMLGEGYLGSGFTLAEARVIYELAQREAPTSRQIGAALKLDAGYLSRILKRLEGQGLVRRTRAEGDKRQHRLALTPDGRQAFDGLDQGAKDSMAGLVAHLPAPELDRLSGAMDAIEELVAARPADASSCATAARGISAGSWSATPVSTPRSRAGTPVSRPWWPASWRR